MSATVDPLRGRVYEEDPDEIDASDAVRAEGEISASPREVANASKLAASEVPGIDVAVRTMTPVVGRPNVMVDANGDEWVDEPSAVPAEVTEEAEESDDIVLRAPYVRAGREELQAELDRIQADKKARRLAEEKVNAPKRRRRIAIFAAVAITVTLVVAAIIFGVLAGLNILPKKRAKDLPETLPDPPQPQTVDFGDVLAANQDTNSGDSATLTDASGVQQTSIMATEGT